MNLTTAPNRLPNPQNDTVEEEHLRTLSEIPTAGCVSLDEIVLFYQNFIRIFSNNEVRERALSNRTLVLAILGAVDKVLSLLDAAKSTYFNTNRYSSLDREEPIQPSSLVCLKCAVTVGRHVLSEEESNLIARDIIKALALRLGREATNLKQWLYQDTGLDERNVFKTDEVEQILPQIWALIAAMRES
ncbi:hypothetical protein NX059_012395 [Plenodomus lindquistii]|nr:hypothetical protein NX059_012395 [Plenodomus lindquistii]